MTVIKQYNPGSSTWEPVLVGAGVPPGGTVGQVVAKASSTNYDTEWVNQSGGMSQATADTLYLSKTGDDVPTAEYVVRAITAWGDPSAESVFQHLGCDYIWINQGIQIYKPIYLDGTGNVPTDPRHATSKGYVDGLLANKQPLDADLTAIAALVATTGNMILSAGSAWTSATPATVKTALGLDQVTNTSDANKPVSTAQATAIGLKADKTITMTGTGALTGGGGLDANRTLDVATAGITLAKMANLAQDQVIGRVSASTGTPETFTITTAARTVLDDTTTAAMLTTLGAQPVDADLSAIAALVATTGNMILSAGSAWTSANPATVKTALALNNVDNTTDVGKPVSTAQATAIGLKVDKTITVTGTGSLTDGGALDANRIH